VQYHHATRPPCPMCMGNDRGSWVMWVMGQLCVTKDDPFPSLTSTACLLSSPDLLTYLLVYQLVTYRELEISLLLHVVNKTKHPYRLFVTHNSAKCQPIFKTLSVVYSSGNLQLYKCGADVRPPGAASPSGKSI